MIELLTLSWNLISWVFIGAFALIALAVAIWQVAALVIRWEEDRISMRKLHERSQRLLADRDELVFHLNWAKSRKDPKEKIEKVERQIEEIEKSIAETRETQLKKGDKAGSVYWSNLVSGGREKVY